MSDGYGRDSYILTNNGGLTIPRISNQSMNSKFFDCSISKGPDKTDRKFYGGCSSGLAKNPQKINYPPDGTGRDWYIIQNNNFTPTNQAFQESLR